MKPENHYEYSFMPAPVSAPKRKKGVAILLTSLFLCLTLAGAALGGYFGVRAFQNSTGEETALSALSDIPQVQPTGPVGEPSGLWTVGQEAGGTLSYREIYQKSNPGAVAIVVESTGMNVFGQPTVRASAGSGFVLTESGYVVTNNHVIQGASSVKVLLWDGREYDAEMVGSDAQTDIAVLKIEADGLTALEVGDSDALQVGDPVAVIGNPLGEWQNSMTAGIISALGREVNIDGTPMKMLQTDAAVNRGNSGGPLLNAKGQVVGIISAKSMGSGVEGLGFAIPMNDAQTIIGSLMQDGYVTGRPYIGISGQTITEQMARYYSLSVGVYVQDVVSGSAAEKAGLRRGDVILNFGEAVIQTREDLNTAKQAYKAGDRVTMRILRNGEELTLSIVLDEERPEQAVLPLPNLEQAA